jgi:hypothetical protein
MNFINQLAIVLFAVSCGGTYLPVSAPTVTDFPNWSANDYFINGPGIKIHLAPSTHPLVSRLFSNLDGSFGIIMTISADDISSYTFDPTQVKLTVADGSSPTYARVYPRVQPSDSAQGQSVRELNRQITLSEKNRSLELRFNIAPPSADKEFTLMVGGLARKGTSLALPEIVFRKTTKYIGGSFI